MRSIKALLSDRVSVLGFLLALSGLIVLLVILLQHGKLQAETAPLHYNIYFGIDLAGPGTGVLLPWAVALTTTVINLVLAVITAERDRLAGRLLAWFSVSVVALVTAASILVLTYHP